MVDEVRVLLSLKSTIVTSFPFGIIKAKDAFTLRDPIVLTR